MKCNNCGFINENSVNYCINCGLNLKNIDTNKNIDKEINHVNKSNSNPKLVKMIVIIIILIMVLFFGSGLYLIFRDKSILKWVNESDSNVIVTSSTVKLSVIARDKNNFIINNVSFKADGGEIKYDNNTVEWTLPDKPGIYTITAISPTGKKIKKSISTMTFEDDELLLNSDIDHNTKEQDIKLIDSDKDGVPDEYEKTISKTNQNKADSDEDGLDDGDELLLGLDPLKSDSKGDGVYDGKRTMSYFESFDNGNVEVEVTGKGNIASLTVDVNESKALNSKIGFLPKIYNISDEGSIDGATIKIKYSEEDLREKELNEDNLRLFYFNTKNRQMELVDTIVDKENNLIISKLNHFSSYVMADFELINTTERVDVMFVIDNSISMYSEEQLYELGYESSGAVGNDVDFKRISLSKKMIERLEGNYNFSISEFSGDYYNYNDFYVDKKELNNALDSIKNLDKTTDGTNIINALKSGIDDFNEENKNNYLILMTDGMNNEGNLSEETTNIITNAKNKNVKICVIGLGDTDTKELNNIANETGCKFVSTGASSSLEEIYDIIGSAVDYDLVDTDSDNKTDSTIIRDSGFVVNRDGFSFENYNTKQNDGGNCYGMALFAYLRYKRILPSSLDSVTKKKNMVSKKRTSEGYDLSWTYFMDYDKNLYDYKFSNEFLSHYLYKGGWPSDMYGEPDLALKILPVKDEYKEQLAKSGIITKFVDCSGGRKYNKCEVTNYLDIYLDKFVDNNKKDDVELLHAINRLFVVQTDDEEISMSVDPDDFFDYVSDNLNGSNPIILTIEYGKGGHAVNAIKLIQDNDDSGIYKIQIYDSNYPGEYKYITLKRHKYKFHKTFDFQAFTNDYYYEASYDLNNDGELSDKEKSIKLNIVTAYDLD